VAACHSAGQKLQAIRRLQRARSCICSGVARVEYTHPWPHGVNATRPTGPSGSLPYVGAVP
jgi:hypothetical protein